MSKDLTRAGMAETAETEGAEEAAEEAAQGADGGPVSTLRASAPESHVNGPRVRP